MPILKQVGFVDDRGLIHLTRSDAATANLRYNTERLHWLMGTDEQNEQLLAALETWRAEKEKHDE